MLLGKVIHMGSIFLTRGSTPLGCRICRVLVSYHPGFDWISNLELRWNAWSPALFPSLQVVWKQSALLVFSAIVTNSLIIFVLCTRSFGRKGEHEHFYMFRSAAFKWRPFDYPDLVALFHLWLECVALDR